MEQISKHLKYNLQSSLLGRLKLKLYQLITSQPDYMPDPREFREFILEQYSFNSEVGKLFALMLNANHSLKVGYSHIEHTNDIQKMLAKLQKMPLQPHFIELTECPEPLPETIGVFTYPRALGDNGWVYVVTLFSEKEFYDHFFGRLEIRAYEAEPEPTFAILNQGTFDNYSIEEYQEDFLVDLVVKILNFASKEFDKQFVQWKDLKNSQLSERPDVKPPPDSRFMKAIRRVTSGLDKCTRAKVELAKVQPHNFDFCMSYPINLVDKIIARIERGQEIDLIVYWNGSSYIMSDSYPYYLGYRKLGYEKVTVVIMGDFPEKTAEILTVGDTDLIPPVTIDYEDNYKSLSPELKDQLLQFRLTWKAPSTTLTNLYSLHMQLTDLIRAANTKEKHLHEFLLNNPIALDSYGLQVMSEVRLGKQYRIDLILQYSLVSRRIMLIELERSDIPIFTKKGRQRSEVTHAIQQVEDWLRWWKENPSQVPQPLDSSIPVDGLVVIGRSEGMDEDTKRRLLHLNSHRKVKVITYDDLLEQIKALITNLEDAEANQNK